MNKKSYYDEINFVRAVGALSVVMVHITAVNYSLNGKDFGSFMLFLNQITRYGTPFFAIISGFLLYNQVIRKRYNFKKFIKSRFTKVLIPFFIWSIIYLIQKSYAFSEITDFNSFKNFLYDFMMGKSSYHLYFIVVVVQFYLLFPFIQKFHSLKHLLILTIIGLYLNYFHLVTPFELNNEFLNQMTKERSFVFNWIFYFFLGGLLVHLWPKLMTWTRQNILTVLMIGMVAFTFTIYEYIQVDRILTSTKPSNIITVPLLFLMFAGLYFVLEKLKYVNRIMLWIGNMSMGIYLVHPFVINYFRDKITWLFEYSFLVPIAYVTMLFLTIVIVKFIHKLPLGHYIVIIAPKRKKIEEQIYEPEVPTYQHRYSYNYRKHIG